MVLLKLYFILKQGNNLNVICIFFVSSIGLNLYCVLYQALVGKKLIEIRFSDNPFWLHMSDEKVLEHYFDLKNVLYSNALLF